MESTAETSKMLEEMIKECISSYRSKGTTERNTMDILMSCEVILRFLYEHYEAYLASFESFGERHNLNGDKGLRSAKIIYNGQRISVKNIIKELFIVIEIEKGLIKAKEEYE